MIFKFNINFNLYKFILAIMIQEFKNCINKLKNI